MLYPIRILALTGMALVFQQTVLAQSDENDFALLRDYSPVTDSLLQNPPDSDWLMWRRTYDLSGHSPLDQINRSNVAELKLAWSAPLGQGGNMTTPLVHDGILFIADTGNVLLALDARNGQELWRYQHESENLDGRRIGIALHGDKVIVPHNDLDLVALNIRTGQVVWEHPISTPTTEITRGYYSLRGAPMIANGIIVQGVGATVVAEGGFIVGLDLETGAEQWRFHTVARPDGPGGNTWNNLPQEARSGGSVWIPGSYDPALDLVFFGTAPTYDTAPLMKDLGIDGVSNAALYTNATLALRPRSGELVWHFQHMPNDQWDLDWVYERQLATLEIDGQQRRIVFTAGKMALYDVLDATTGKYIDSVDTGIQNMISHIDPETGDKTLHPIAIPNAELGHLLCPYLLGGRNWQAASYDSSRKMVYLPLSEVCMMGGPTGQDSLLTSGVTINAVPRPDTDGNFGRLQAIDLNTMELAWAHREITPPTTATLVTGGDLVFGGFLDQTFKAFDADSGEVLWQTSLEHIPSSFPITYAVEGKQYVAIVRGQPSRFVGSLYGIISGFLGENSSVIGTPSTSPALMVFAL
ncbi:MAG: PQQ-binding-like beta-propeller repeat protein [Pseudohongiellaceae bacterium]